MGIEFHRPSTRKSNRHVCIVQNSSSKVSCVSSTQPNLLFQIAIVECYFHKQIWKEQQSLFIPQPKICAQIICLSAFRKLIIECNISNSYVEDSCNVERLAHFYFIKTVMDVEVGLAKKPTGAPAYEVLPLYKEFAIDGPDWIDFCRQHSVGHKINKGFWTLLTAPVSWIWVLGRTSLIPAGHIGISVNNGNPEFLPPGWHYLGSWFRGLKEVVPINNEKPIVNLTRGIVTIPDGKIGIARNQGAFLLLGPGLHQWNSPTFEWFGTKTISSELVQQLGPYTLVTVPPGEVAITENNGTLVILDENQKTGHRTHFLDHSKWVYKGLLSLQIQIDDLPSSNLLSADRVEVNLDSTVAWHILDPIKVGKSGGHTMEQIREVVHRAGRACLSNMIAHRKISDQVLAHSVDKGQQGSAAYERGGPIPIDEDQFQRASRQQLQDCNQDLAQRGVEVTQLAIVRMTIHHEDIRQKITDVAAIPAQAQKIREMAKAEADKVIVEAEGRAKARKLEAEATALAIRTIAEAQEEAGKRLGEHNTTASRLAQIAATGEALRNAKSTVYFTQQGQTPSLLLQN